MDQEAVNKKPGKFVASLRCDFNITVFFFSYLVLNSSITTKTKSTTVEYKVNKYMTSLNSGSGFFQKNTAQQNLLKDSSGLYIHRP